MMDTRDMDAAEEARHLLALHDTQFRGAESAATLEQMIASRNRKTRHYRRAMGALAFGLVCYITNVIVYLLSDAGRGHLTIP